MLESLNLPGGIYLPRLRWAKKDDKGPQNELRTSPSRSIPSSPTSRRTIPPKRARGGPYLPMG